MREELARRMGRAQRHRLLHGYPMAPLLRRAVPREASGDLWRRCDGALVEETAAPDPRSKRVQRIVEEPWIDVDGARPLIVGILPHTMCTPKVKGCGFCTFPHSKEYDKSLALDQEHEAADDVRRMLDGPRRRVLAVYFGGATANLATEETIETLFGAVAAHADVTESEVTLEGIPARFVKPFGDRLARFAALPARCKRISMGIQTFSARFLNKMGRSAFGDGALFARVVDCAHRRGLTASGDLLFNLPGQTLDEMKADVDQAVSIGLDQICIYNLVLYEGLGTEWSKDRAMLDAMPSNDRACAAWLALREALLEKGYVQTTLTNFERRDVHEGERRFRYEELSFTPGAVDAVGCGPHGISTFLDLGRRRGVKLVRVSPSEIDELSDPWGGADLWFPYDEADMRILFLTRALARTAVGRGWFAQALGCDPAEAFAPALAACAEAGLATVDDEAIRLTPEGMFYADAVAGLIAAARAEAVRAHGAGQRTLAIIDRPPFYLTMG